MYFNYKPIVTYGLRYSSNEQQQKKHLIKTQLNLEFIKCGGTSAGSSYVYHHIMMECGIIINTFVPVDFSCRATNQKLDYKARLHTSYRWWEGRGGEGKGGVKYISDVWEHKAARHQRSILLRPKKITEMLDLSAGRGSEKWWG